MRFAILTAFLLSFAIVDVRAALADSWALPETRTVCSKNNKYCLRVIPKKLKGQLEYFKDKVDGKGNADADKKVENNLCRGIYSTRDDNGSLRKRWEINLVNEVSPVDVLVSDSGDYVVTFDNWHSVGYGDDAVAIYETSSGKLIQKFGLSDFLTEGDIHELPRSVSSIWWGGKHLIDKEKKQLVLQVTKGKRSHEQNAEYFQVRVDLSTGKILDEKRDRLPTLRFLIEPVGGDVSIKEEGISEQTKACLGESTERLTSEALIKRAVTRVVPDYPAAARAVRAIGKIVVAIKVNTIGVVECAEPVSGHPLLRAAVTNAAKAWTFEKAENPYSALFVFNGTIALVNPDGTIVKNQ